MGSISHHIAPLVINSLGGRHTSTHTRKQTLVDRTNSKKPGPHQPAAGAPGLKIHKISVISSHYEGARLLYIKEKTNKGIYGYIYVYVAVFA